MPPARDPGGSTLGIRVPAGDPGTLHAAGGDLRGAAFTLDRVSRQIGASAHLPGWRGLAAWSFADRCVDDQQAARRGSDSLLAAAKIVEHLADQLSAAQKAARAAVRDAEAADAHQRTAQRNADDARTRATAARGRALLAEATIGMAALTGDPAPGAHADRSAALDEAGRADAAAAACDRAATRAQQELDDARRVGNKAAERYERAARHAAGAINGLAGSLPQFAAPSAAPHGRPGGEEGRPEFLGPAMLGASAVNYAREGVSEGARIRASALGRLLGTSDSAATRSAAARYLPSAGRWGNYDAVKFAGKAALPVGVAFSYVGNRAEGRSVADSAARTGAQTAGAVAGGAVGSLACGADVVVTAGFGAVACPVFIGGLSMAGDYAGGKIYDGGKWAVHEIGDLFD